MTSTTGTTGTILLEVLASGGVAGGRTSATSTSWTPLRTMEELMAADMAAGLLRMGILMRWASIT